MTLCKLTTVRNEVSARYCYYTCLSVILFTGGVSGRHFLRQTPLGRQTPPEKHTPRKVHPPEAHFPRKAALQKHSPGKHTLLGSTPIPEAPPSTATAGTVRILLECFLVKKVHFRLNFVGVRMYVFLCSVFKMSDLP